MTTETAIIPTHDIQPIFNLVLDGLNSAHSRRAYGKALVDFMAWYQAEGKPGLSKATIQRYKAVLSESDLSPSSVNLRLSAVRKLAQEAADNGLIDQALANGIANVKGVKMQGERAGNWLTLAQAQELISSPDVTILKGLRDKAILAVMVGAGLRRSEVAALTFQHIQQREGRWVLVDLVGKGNRVRTVPIPPWTKAALDAWTGAAEIDSAYVFRSIRKGGSLNGEAMTSQAVQDVVKFYAARLKDKDARNLAAHDLRRTFAKLAHKGGAGIDQIQLSLGHASIKTTERYLGVAQDLTQAPCDVLGLKLE